jgi:hypothetical protein
MKPVIWLALAISFVAAPTPAVAQDAESRFADVRRVSRKPGGHVKQAQGWLILDPHGREVRFEDRNRGGFKVPFDSITSIHSSHVVSFDSGWWPRREWTDYATLHYVDSSGRDTFETLRLSGSDQGPLLATLERDTGHKIYHTTGTWSFPGIPVRAAIGDRVTVTDSSGQTSKGTIKYLTASAITLDGPDGALRVFDQAGVRRIKFSHSMRHDAWIGLRGGAITGALMGALTVAALSNVCAPEFVTCDAGETARALGRFSAIGGGIGGGVGAAFALPFGAIRYPFDKSKVIYVNDAPGAIIPSSIAVVPHISKDRKGLSVAMRF